MKVTVWWKSDSVNFTEFTDVEETRMSALNSQLIILLKKSGEATYINANEIFYIEEVQNENDA
jgi:hypothetical protein